jgi:hypothetical protein
MTVGASLYAWTASMAAPALLPLSTDGGVWSAPRGSASANSQWVEHSTTSDPGTAQQSVAHVDGTSSKVLGEGVVEFDGPRAVYGLPYPSYTVDTVPLVALDPAHAWSQSVLSASSEGFVVDQVGQHVLLSSNDGITLVPLDGGAPVIVDPQGRFQSAYLAPDASFAVYFTAQVGVVVVALPGGAPYALSEAGQTFIQYLVSVRADTPSGPVGAFEVAESLSYETTYGVRVVALSPDAGAPNVLLPQQRLATDYADGDGFTADGAYALLIGTAPGGTFTFGSLALPNGTALTLLTSDGYDGRALTGSRVIFLDHYARTGQLQYQGVGDFRVADVAVGTASTLVVADVDAAYGLSPDRTALAYTINRGTSADGLYVTVLPAVP